MYMIKQSKLIFIFFCVFIVSCKTSFLKIEKTQNSNSNIEVYDLKAKIGSGKSDADVYIELDSKYYLTPDSEQPTESELLTYINKEQGNLENIHFTNAQLANRLLKISQCFKIDAFMFAALIRQESRFYHWKYSASKAVGLTQFTRIAIKEVQGQLGMLPLEGDLDRKTIHFIDNNGTRSSRVVSLGASQVAIKYFNNTLSNCFAKNYKWENLWELAEKQEQEQSEGAIAWSINKKYEYYKKTLITNLDMSLAFGAVLLKTLLIIRNKTENSMIKTYKTVLYSYNGNKKINNYERWGQLQEREHYWRIIIFEHLRRLYTKTRKSGLVVLNPSLKIINTNNKNIATVDPTKPRPDPAPDKPKQEPMPLPDHITTTTYYCESYICFKPFMVDVTALFVRSKPPSDTNVKASLCMTKTSPKNRLLVYKGDEVFIIGQHSKSGWLRILPRVRTTNWDSLDCDETWVNGQFLFPLY